MKTKRKPNTTAIKVKYLAPTMHKNGRLKFTQTNNKKGFTVDIDPYLTPFEQMEQTFEKVQTINSYQLIIDNTQNDHYLFVVDFEATEIPDFIQTIKIINK
jgi:hypothetical protein